MKTATDRDDDTTGNGWRLAINGADCMAALIKRQLVDLGRDVISPLYPLPLKREHRRRIVERDEGGPVVVEQVVVVLHEG